MPTHGSVIVATYLARHRADAVAEELRRNKIPAAVMASADRAGASDVVVRPNYAERAKAIMEGR